MDYIDAFRAAIVAAGLEAPSQIIADGNRHRFSSNGKPGDKSGWFRLYGDDRPAGSFGCWRTGFSATWKYDTKREFTPEEKQAWKAKMQALEQEREAERQEAMANAAKQSAQMWGAGLEADHPSASHPYLKRKKIPLLGARVLKDMLLIPVRQSAKEMVGLQRIWPDGTKRPVVGTPMQGSYTTIGKAKESAKVVICEGWATGVSIHLATGYCVVVAFTAGNLKPVADKIAALLPGKEVVVAADDDAWTVYPPNHPKAGQPWNPGLEAAHATGLPVYVPRWYGDREEGWTDFNDLHVSEGLGAVKECFEVPVPPVTPPPTVKTEPPALSETASEPDEREVPEWVAEPHGEPHVEPAAEHHDEPAAVETLPAINTPATPKQSRQQQAQPRSFFDLAREYGLDTNDKGVPHSNVSNCLAVLTQDPELQNTIWFDEFMDRVMTMWRSDKPREWTEVDDINLQAYLQQRLGFSRVGKMTVQDAVLAVAYQDRRNEAKAYIESLTWDGVPRLQKFSQQIFGTDDTEYMRMAGQNFWVSMVARVLKPGCKVDTMIVLEGPQGAGKSKALAIIGGQWFTEATQSPTDKDFYLNLAGKMIVEIGEMDAFRKAEVTKVKQVITCQVDRYRAPYERRAADHPRRCVFAGTTNRDDWNKDETGARRFWPIYCQKIDHKLLTKNRDQYFAEAAYLLNSGADWWNMPEEETKKQQEARRDADELEGQIHHYLIGKNEVSVYEIMDEMMKLSLERQDKSVQMRVAKCLRVLNWKRPEAATWRGGKLVRLWYRPGITPQNDLSELSE